MWSKYSLITFGIIVLVVIVLALSATIQYYYNDWMTTATVLMAGFAGLGIVYSSITVTLMRGESRPYMFVDFVLDETAPSMIDIELINQGKGSANNIHIKVVSPEKEKTMLENHAVLYEMSKISIFANEIKFCPPERKIRVMYGIGHMMSEYLPFEYTFILDYQDVYGHKYNETITIEPMHLMSCPIADKRTDQLLKDVVENTRQLAVILNSVSKSTQIMSGETKLCPICQMNIIGIKEDCCCICSNKKA